MRQVWITKAGEPEVLELREAADPKPKGGEVRIRVEAAGVNFADIMARLGIYPDSPPLPCVGSWSAAPACSFPAHGPCRRPVIGPSPAGPVLS